MDAYSLGLKPEDNITGKHIDFHPQLPVIAIGGIYRATGAVKFIFHRASPGQDGSCFEVLFEAVQPLSSVESIHFSPTGRFLAVAGCDAETYKLLVYRFLPSHDEFVGLHVDLARIPTSAAILPRDVLRLRKSREDTLVPFRRFLLDTWPTSIAWSPDGTIVALAGGNGMVSFISVCSDNMYYNVVNDERRRDSGPQVVKVCSSQLLSITWSPCGSLLAAQSLSSMFLIVCTCTKQGQISYSVRTKMNAVEATLLGGFLAYGRMATPGEYEKYVKTAFLKDEPRGIMNVQQQPESLLLEQQALLNKRPKAAATASNEDGHAGDTQSKEVPNQAGAHVVSLFLERGPEKALSHERRSLRTMYAISLYKRGCAYSPDGAFLVATCGFLPATPDNGANDISGFFFCSYVLSRQTLLLERDRPLAPNVILPGHRFPSVDVAFSPHLYELCPALPNYSGLPYSMLFAVISGCDITIYTTQDFSAVATFKGDNYQTSFLTCISWSPYGNMVCAFGTFHQYTFLKLPPECTRLYLGDKERAYIQSIVELSVASLMQEEQLARTQYKRLYYVYKLRLQAHFTADPSAGGHRPTPPKKPLLKHFAFLNILRLCLGSQASSEETNSIIRKVTPVPCFALSRRLHDYGLAPPPTIPITEADLNIDLLKEEFKNDAETQHLLAAPEARHKRSRVTARDNSPPPLISPAVVIAGKQSARTTEKRTAEPERNPLLDQMAASKPALDENGRLLPVYDKDYEQIAAQLVTLTVKSKQQKVSRTRRSGSTSRKTPDRWQHKGWVSSSEDELDEDTSEYYSDNSNGTQ